LPGRLSDVFGLRTNEFYRHWAPLEVALRGETLKGSDPYYEILELGTAKPLAMFTNTPEKSVAMSVNTYGKGRAIYLAAAPQAELLGSLVRSLYPELGIKRGPETPDGVVARVVEGRTLYVNTDNAPKTVTIAGTKTGVLSGRRFTDKMDLPPYGVELLQ
jgi:beta-galactosidase